MSGDVLAHVCPSEGVLVVAETGSQILLGDVYERLIPLLQDGDRSVVDIVRELDKPCGAAVVYYALLRLQRLHLLTEEDEPASEANWEIFAIRASQSAEPRTVALDFVGTVPPDLCRAWFEGIGWTVVESGGAADHRILLADDYLRSELEPISREMTASRQPWLLCKPVGARIWFGPVLGGARGSCWDCLRTRLARNQPSIAFLERLGDTETVVPLRRDESQPASALALIPSRLSWHERNPAFVEVLDGLATTCSRHKVPQRPDCARCGDRRRPLPAEPRDWFGDRDSPRTLGTGGYRVVSPDRSVRRFAPHVDPLFGVVREFRRLRSDSAPWAQVYAADAAMGDASTSLAEFRERAAAWSGGKGVDAEQALASALGEAIERYSGAFQGGEQVIRGSFAELGAEAVDPRDLLLLSERQMTSFEYRSRWASFDPDRDLDWTPVRSLSTDRPRYVPTQLLYFGFGVAAAERLAPATSNGCAAGNTWAEAVLQGLFELVERDAVALWWYNRVRRPRVSREALDSDILERFERLHREIGREVWLLDLSTDLGIPCLAAVSRSEIERGRILLGFGAHPVADVAAARALTELNQLFPIVDRPTDAIGKGLKDWIENARCVDHPHLSPQGPPVTEFPSPSSDVTDLRAEVDRWVRRLAVKSLEVLVLDQTRTDIDVPVVRVLVPGLRPIAPRFAAGRLYDAPVELGWITVPREETSLNPTPMFL